jgi:biopolymer transport protein ExbB
MQYLTPIVDYGIIGLLIFMSFLSFWFFLERVLYFRSVDPLAFATKEKLELDLSERLTLIATVAANAPYIGLLGTVLAIMQTFVDMSRTQIEAGVIMESLALALKTTAIGLAVAIMAVVFYNILSRQIERLLVRYEAAHVSNKQS